MPTSQDNHSLRLKLAVLFLFLSGIASLIYQVTWVRLLQLSIGSTSVAVSLVIAAFFIGLAIGSYLTTRFTHYAHNSFKPYLILESIIGLTGLALLPILLNLDFVLTLWPTLGDINFVKFLVVITLLAVPSMCIGATYPLMSTLLIHRQNDIGSKLSLLYGVNTAGAVVGTILSGFLFIPYWGLDGAIYSAVLLNFSIVLIGITFDFQLSDSQIPSSEQQAVPEYPDDCSKDDVVKDNKKDSPTIKSSPQQIYALLALATTGFVSLACEVGWTKYLSIFTHTTIYGFSAILAIFLVGIFAGAWLIKFRIDTIADICAWVTKGLLLLVASLILSRVALNEIPVIYKLIFPHNEYTWFATLVKYGLIFSALIVPTLLLGALFSLNIRMYANAVEQLQQRVGFAYAINTVGGIAGALVAGLWIIPTYNTNTLLVLIITLMIITAATHLVIRKQDPQRPILAGVMLLLLSINFMVPSLDYRKIIDASPYYFDPAAKSDIPQKFIFLKEGKTGVISVSTFDDKSYRLQTNNLPEAVVTPPDPFPWLSETLLGLFPYFILPSVEQVFTIGLGAGTTLSALTLTDIQHIHLVELEPYVVEANKALYPQGLAALQDPRVEIKIDDARHRLLMDNFTYDAIVSQPSHPWVAGNANLFTHEFFQLASRRLNKNGVFLQWINLFNMDATTLRAIFQAMYQVFPYGFTLNLLNESTIILVASNEPIYFDLNTIEQRITEPQIQQVIGRWGGQSAFDLLRVFGMSRSEALQLANGVEANTDTNILSEVRLSQISAKPSGNEDVYALLTKQFRFSITQYLLDNSPSTLNNIYNHLISVNENYKAQLLLYQISQQPR